ncbi:fungal-specific transcription factor domain-containing protein [Pisolithus microcarpus]|nr:fungal-specific transcription factor domain-containing protein [Pisolithus microcarpus]
MPPVPTRPKLKHKSSRGDLGEPGYGDTRAREIEQKRISGKISCAECTRLKIKCDKKVPCQSCRRRGCAALCPNESLSTGQGTRFVLAATEHLHRRIAKMSERIQQLEDALCELQAKHSMEPHPLLRSELSGASGDTTVVERTPDLVEALGTLSISDAGVSRFFGPTGGSHCLLMVDDVPPQDSADGSSHSARDSSSSEEFENVTPVFPFKPTHLSLSVETLANNYLPTWDRAHYLTEVYLEQASWLIQTVSNDQIVLELLPDYYSNGAPHAMQAKNNRHRLGLLFLVFAFAAFLDANRKPGNAEAEFYHEVARATICLPSVMEKPSLETIQLLQLLSIYNTVSGNELAGKETSMETSWSLVALAAHLAHTLGLHRDGLKWGLSADVTARRRAVFWDLFVADVWNSLETGRPPTFSLPYIDCQFPGGGSPDGNGHIDTNREVFWASWVFRFASSCAADVAARTLTSDSPSYSTILELDRKVRNFPVPATIEEFVATASGAIPMKPADKDIGLTESLGRFVMSTSREVILLYLHRSFFAQAIVENPINPMNSSYTPSFLAAYQASLIILRTVKIVFGTIVTHGPRSSMASSSMEELRNACLLFSKASPCNRRAQKALPIITKLMEKAQNALLRAQSDIPHELGQQWLYENEGDDELAIFAGRTKIVSVKRHTTDGMSSSPAFMPQHKQVQVESVGEELDSTWLHRPGPAASLEQTQEMPTWDRSLYPDTASKSTAPLRTPHVPTQAPVEPVVPPSCSGEELGSRWLQQPGSVAGLGQTQDMSIWDSPLQIPPHVPSEASAHGEVAAGSSTGGWSRELSDPYPMANVSAPCTQAYPQGYHPPHDRYDQHGHCPPTSSASSTVSYYDYPFASAGAHHHQSWPQSHPSTHSPPHLHHAIQPPHCPHQPMHSDPPQPQTVPLVPPELAQLGLVTQESGLDQRWVSFMRESGFFDG